MLLCALVAASTAHGAGFTLTSSTSAGLLYGSATELVFDTSAYDGKDYILSELDWDLRPLFYAGYGLSIEAVGGFHASLDAKLGVPAMTGSIQDSDWLNYDVNGDPSKTNFSRHDSFSERAILLDARVGWAFAVTSWLILEPFASAGFMDFKWSARDGYLQYPPGYMLSQPPPYAPWTENTAKVPVSGTGIIYEQSWFVPALGLAAGFSLGSGISVSASFAAAPWVFCKDIDNHLFTESDYYDTMAGGYSLEPAVSMEWKLSGNAVFSLGLSYSYLAGLRGTTTVVESGSGITPGTVVDTITNGAGVEFQAAEGYLRFQIAL
jgi:outer membrane protease